MFFRLTLFIFQIIIQPISEVSDLVFAQKTLGDGFAILAEDGKIMSIFPSQHAIGMMTDNQLDVLIHRGIDTLELNGQIFSTLVKEGDNITPETILSHVDLSVLQANQKEATMIVVFTNSDIIKDFSLHTTGSLKIGDEIGTVYLK